MLRFLLTSFLLPVLVLLSGCGPFDETAESTVAITPNVKTDACATNYTRMGPNFCMASTAFVDSHTVVSFGSCQTHTPTSLPAGARYVMVNLDLRVRGSSVAGTDRGRTVNIYFNTTCTNFYGLFSLEGREQSAVTSVQTIVANSSVQIWPLVNGTIRYNAGNSTALNGNTSWTILGYYD